jgi:hypothetical protein
MGSAGILVILACRSWDLRVGVQVELIEKGLVDVLQDSLLA